LEGIKVVMPSAVDVNSGVESEPGVKDAEKVKYFFTRLENIEGNGELF
jgi:phosphoribosylanthranilate isomerase